MKAKMKSKLWVWLHCKKVTDEDGWTYWMYKRLDDTQVYLCETVFALAGKVVNVRLGDKDVLDDPSDSAFNLMEGMYPFWIPNWFIKKVL